MTHVSKLHSILSPKPLQFMQLSLVKNRVFKFTGTAELSLSLQVNLLTVYCLFVSIVTLLEFPWYGVKHMTINLFAYLCLLHMHIGHDTLCYLYLILLYMNEQLFESVLFKYICCNCSHPSKQAGFSYRNPLYR